MAHTPGPWIVTKEGIETEGCDVVLLIVRVGHPSIKTPNTDDLRLIAAAPDILAALKPFAAFFMTPSIEAQSDDFSVYVTDTPAHGVTKITMGDLRRARATLAKAEGR